MYPRNPCPICGRLKSIDATHCRQCYVSLGGNSRPLADRFWEKVVRGAPDECWQWTGDVDRRGYGRIHIDGTPGRMTGAHRVSWMLHHGPIPDGVVVCHTCDNPICTNPAHLFLGSTADNLADMRTKGRQARGETHGHTKTTDDDIRNIRRMVAAGASLGEAATKYHLTKAAVCRIVQRKTWQHVE